MKVQGWEYMEYIVNEQAVFPARSVRELGKKGWELISVVVVTRRDGSTAYLIAYFKRPLPDEVDVI